MTRLLKFLVALIVLVALFIALLLLLGRYPIAL